MFLPNGGRNYDNGFLPEGYGASLPPVNVMYGNSQSEPSEFATMNPYSSTEDVGPNSNYYARGGEVKRRTRQPRGANTLPAYADLVQAHGQRGDSILAHINPEEAEFLEENFGGDINPHTGLPQYGLFSSPGKYFSSILAPSLGVLAGNALLPGFGGIIGGAAGGAAGSSLRNRKDYGKSALRGAGMGAITPTLAGFAGSGANALGAKGVGSALTDYGNKNSILAALGMGGGGSEGASALGLGAGAGEGYQGEGATGGNYRIEAGDVGNRINTGAANTSSVPDANKDFLGSLTAKSKNFLSEPQNLLTLGALGLSLANRPKEKSPEQLGAEDKRRNLASSLYTPEELARLEAQDLQMSQAKRRVARNKFLPEERIGNIDPVYVKYNDPDEAKKKNRWIEYYSNPEFSGEPIYRKSGGKIPEITVEEEVIEYPSGAYMLRGITGGQDDVRNMMIPENSHIIDASVLSGLGDGNSEAGARKIEAYLSDGEMVIPPMQVAKLGNGNIEKGHKALKTMTKNVRKHKGGSIKLPPKAKQVKQYIRGK